MPRIEIKGLTKKFGNFEAVRNVSLTVEDREYVSVIGPSGCGKTTLLRTIAGILRQEEGHIYFDDDPVDERPIEERRVGYVFQNIALFPHMNVWDNVSYGPRIKAYESKITRAISIEMLEMMKLSERYRDYPIELSGGMQQKAAVARSLASEPSVLLLDEPLSMLDAKVRTELRFELRKIAKDLGLTAIHVTHDQEEAMAISDRIFVMRKGQIIEVGRPDELYLNSKQIFTAYFLGESNIFEGNVISMEDGVATIETDGFVIRASSGGLSDSAKVVAVIRPESMEIGEGDEGHSIRATVKNVSMEGLFLRYELEVGDESKIVLKQPFSTGMKRYSIGSRIPILVRPDRVRIYSYPEGGLNREIEF